MKIEPAAGSPVPLLLISDAPSSSTGLGRITRDLAVRLHTHLWRKYRVGVLGYGGPGSRKFGFQQYSIEGMNDWTIQTLPEVWEDFAGNQRGICMTIWDASRLMWFAQPAHCEMLAGNPVLQKWLVDAPFERWGYFPIDAVGPRDRLSFPLRQTLLGFDRILAYGNWAADVIDRSIGSEEATRRSIEYLPHGINAGTFYERDRVHCRLKFGTITGARTLIRKPQLSSVTDNEVLIGIVATNQNRKNWALGIETVSLLAKDRNVRLWIHTDSLERSWSIPALLADYDLVERTVISLGYLPDEEMAQAYSACDVTLGIGSGEGFGFPIFESLFCGTPCVHGDYAGAPEYMWDELLVQPTAFYTEAGLYGCRRPVFCAEDWVEKIVPLLGKRNNHPNQLDWHDLWSRWEAWFNKDLTSDQTIGKDQ